MHCACFFTGRLLDGTITRTSHKSYRLQPSTDVNQFTHAVLEVICESLRVEHDETLSLQNITKVLCDSLWVEHDETLSLQNITKVICESLMVILPTASIYETNFRYGNRQCKIHISKCTMNTIQ